MQRRDYTREVINTRPAPPPPSPPPKQSPKKTTKKAKLIWLPIVLVLAIAAAGIWWFLLKSNTPKQPAFQQKLSALNVSFPLYYPTSLPGGYSFNDGSISSASGVVLFTAKNNTGKQISFTEQQKPANYDFSNLSGTTEINTPLGKGYIEDFDVRTTGSLVGIKTWIIVNTSSPIGSESMQQILNSLQAANKS
jgi:hypothetical protein